MCEDEEMLTLTFVRNSRPLHPFLFTLPQGSEDQALRQYPTSSESARVGLSSDGAASPSGGYMAVLHQFLTNYFSHNHKIPVIDSGIFQKFLLREELFGSQPDILNN